MGHGMVRRVKVEELPVLVTDSTVDFKDILQFTKMMGKGAVDEIRETPSPDLLLIVITILSSTGDSPTTEEI